MFGMRLKRGSLPFDCYLTFEILTTGQHTVTKIVPVVSVKPYHKEVILCNVYSPLQTKVFSGILSGIPVDLSRAPLSNSS